MTPEEGEEWKQKYLALCDELKAVPGLGTWMWFGTPIASYLYPIAQRLWPDRFLWTEPPRQGDRKP